MLHLLYALVLLLLLCGACAILAERFTLSPALLPLPVLSGAVVVLYLCGVAGFLRVGAVAVLLALAAVWVVGLVQYRPAGVAAAWKRAASVPGFTLFLGGAVFIWVLFCVQQPMFTQWDEFTAWGLAPKMVVERGAFYVADPVNLKASFTYPATSLITFLFQPFGPWAEWACLAAIDTLALACLAAASALPRERWAGGVLVFAAGFLLPFFFSATPTGSYAAQYVNAMADLPLAMLFGGTLCLYFAVGRRKIAYWLVVLPLAVLTLTKDICFAYGLIAAFLIGLDLWLAADEPCRKAFPKALLRAGALAVIVLAVFSSWGRYTAAVTPTADTAASVGSEGLSYGAVLVGGVKQLLGMGRTEKFAQIMAAMHFNQTEKQFAVCHLHRRFFSSPDFQNCRRYCRMRQKSCRWNIHHPFHGTIKLYRQGKRTIILRPGLRQNTIRHFLLHHKYKEGNGQFRLNQVQQNRCRNIVRKIGRCVPVIISQYFFQICFEHIFIDNMHIIISFQRMRQNIFQTFINFKSCYICPCFSKCLC